MEQLVDGYHLRVEAGRQAYDNAQMDDYRGLRRDCFRWSPPARMRLRARFSHPESALRGTAGFGFWNDPTPGRGRMPALPRAVWFFFASPPSNMALDVNVPGWGWKASTFDAMQARFYALAPALPLAAPFMHSGALRRRLWPPFQRALGVREALLDLDMTAWHEYEVVWGPRTARFAVDGRPVLDGAPSPRGPLGLVLWIDNQYAVVTPWGRLGHGALDTPGAQWMEVEGISVELGESKAKT